MFTIDPQMKIKEALEVFLGAEHLGNEAYEDAINYVQFGPLKIPFPNPKARRDIVYLHDVNHILSGYDTSWTGEGEVSAWELASGFPKHCWIGYLYAPQALLVGLIVAPRKCFKAWRRARRGEKNSCFARMSREQLMQTTVADLRAQLGITCSRSGTF